MRGTLLEKGLVGELFVRWVCGDEHSHIVNVKPI